MFEQKKQDLNFDDIRPYYDNEYQTVIKKLIEVDQLMKAIQMYLPELSQVEIKEILLSFHTIRDFQSKMVCRIIQSLINSSSEGFTYDGFQHLDKHTPYVLISNHRDIVSDSALVNFCLNINDYDTCEIAIGSNLLAKPWIKDLVRINKSFIVKRNIPKQELLEASKNLSTYINHTLKDKKQSIWIAQREGRAKDGCDKTNPGVLKMLGLCTDENLLEHLISLNITPVSISYELDPCDALKIPELLNKSEGKEYVKSEGEDEYSMILGVQGKKGHVHVQFGIPINEEIKQFSHIKNKNELLKNIADVIDREIYANYRLWNSNYVAYDLLNKSTKYATNYTAESKQQFIDYMNKKLSNFTGNEKAKQLFLQMYANPLINCESVAVK
ncbi:MAG: glycerol acyltransferase [Flavobacteriales bacterium CG_4_10_14_0_2_um_filter_32_8]|nr:MAG: glycerol acyltransferase [Flavobacteriales bacterium CG_4_10_14_0_2_um_filter_32_8]